MVNFFYYLVLWDCQFIFLYLPLEILRILKVFLFFGKYPDRLNLIVFIYIFPNTQASKQCGVSLILLNLSYLGPESCWNILEPSSNVIFLLVCLCLCNRICKTKKIIQNRHWFLGSSGVCKFWMRVLSTAWDVLSVSHHGRMESGRAVTDNRSGQSFSFCNKWSLM